MSLYDSDITIYVFNIDKFNKDESQMKQLNENLGESFYDVLSKLKDLVLIMDESHHYRADKGKTALNMLKPLLGIELTATPMVSQGGKTELFKNVVYEYPLSMAIADGYTRTPFALTRNDVDFYNFSKEEMDKLMLNDGILCHEKTRMHLDVFASNYNKPKVKPFMLVVCSDTDHANWVADYIKSDDFKQGYYKNKTIILHSKTGNAETVENTKLLLSVEKFDNPIEIVIHVNKLKEGWDVNNLYTIVPLRTSASKVLREQMVGRGLRLPYGELTKDKEIDAVMITAHDKFGDILEEAQRGDSLFKAGNVIVVNDEIPEYVEIPTLNLFDSDNSTLQDTYSELGLDKTLESDQVILEAKRKIANTIYDEKSKDEKITSNESTVKVISQIVQDDIKTDKDLGNTFKMNEEIFSDWISKEVESILEEINSKFIPIPRVVITESGPKEVIINDFEIDLAGFNHVPLENSLVRQSLIDARNKETIDGGTVDFDGINPTLTLLELLSDKPEVDYESNCELLAKLISSVCTHYETLHGEDGLKNIVMMYKQEISNKIYEQLMSHFCHDEGMIKEEIIDCNPLNLKSKYTFTQKQDLFDECGDSILSTLFTGLRKAVFDVAKFDSKPELTFARLCESDADVIKWLRPAASEFNIKYNNGKRYEPDFVIETQDVIYLVEVKGDDRLQDADVISKRERGVQYCQLATTYSKVNSLKPWKHLFIPASQIQPSSTFAQLSQRFIVE